MANINFDNETGSSGRPPKLLSGADFMMWRLRFKAFIYYNDVQLWNSIVNGPHVPQVLETGGNIMIDLEPDKFSELDKKLVDRDFRALGAVILALPNEIYNNFKDCTSTKELMDAMELRYEGSQELRESKKDMLRKSYEMFEWIRGESLLEQINRFSIIVSDLKSLGVILKEGDVCKKLLSSLPNKWSVHVMIIKRTGNINTMTLEELIGILQSYEVDMNIDEKKKSNSSYGCALVTSQNIMSNSGANSGNQIYSSCCLESRSHGNHGMNTGSKQGSDMFSENGRNDNSQFNVQKVNTEEHSVLYKAFVASYEAFVAGNLTQAEFAREDLEQLNPDDLEEMDIKWQMAMITLLG